MNLSVKDEMKENPFEYHHAFSRNLGYISRHEQEILRQSHVAIAGLGGTGGIQAQALVRLGISQFTLCDLDIFELSNFNRQAGATMNTLGKKKTQAVKEMILSINPEAQVRIMENGIHPDTIDTFLSDVDLVMDSLDFFAFDERLLLYRKARQRGLWVINVAPSGFGATLLVFDPKGISFEDYFDMHEGMSLVEKKGAMVFGLNPSPFVLRYLDREILKVLRKILPCIAPAFFLVGGIAATEAIKILLGKGPVHSAPWVFQFDALLQVSKKTYLPWGMKGPLQKIKKWLIFRFFRGGELDGTNTSSSSSG